MLTLQMNLTCSNCHNSAFCNPHWIWDCWNRFPYT